MSKSPGSRPLTQGINALARAARRPRLRRSADRGALVKGSMAFVLGQPAQALARDEVLIAVADASSVAVQRVRLPARYPAASGPAANLAEAARRLAEIELVATEMARVPPVATVPLALLTDSEERLLRDGGLDPDPLAPEEAPLLHRASAEYAKLLHDSYTVEEAAHRLAVNTSRIRQRLTGTPRTLYGIKLGKSWRVPKFQFHAHRLVPGIERVLEQLPGDLHPVAVYRWFTSPSPDLTFEDDTVISPLDWLRIGNAPEVVVKLAADL